MNKSELKNFAVSARRDLLEKVALRAKKYGIVSVTKELEIQEINGKLIVNNTEQDLRLKSSITSLDKQLRIKGYDHLIEEVAYTWFNRIISIRFMEVNEYLPERINVLSSSTGRAEPDIVAEFETMDLGIDIAQIKDLFRKGEIEETYRKLFIAQCNALNTILPFMFEKINDYTELLLPDFLLDSESVINKLVSNDELTESFREVEVIGWLYQFYNSEPKDKVFAKLKKNKKIEKYDIPAATQLFTPKWIVQYMVENSLGQLWLESNPNSPLKDKLRYYIEPAEQDKEVKEKLEKIRYKNINLEEITIIDPCVGSGHILIYAFDLLYQMYEEAGYPNSDIPQIILEKNLYGLDIDDRATQLASFALMMKAREKSRRIFRKQVSLNLFSIQESNELHKEGLAQLLGHDENERKEISSIIDKFHDAKNKGSILLPNEYNLDIYIRRVDELENVQLTTETYQAYEQVPQFITLLKQEKVLSKEYDIVVTNPPYMGSKGMNKNLQNYLKKNFNNTKKDLSTVIMERTLKFMKNNGISAMINIPSWMFLSSYEKLRNELVNNTLFFSLIHLGRGIFGSDFGTVTFVLRKTNVEGFKGTYKRLIDKQGEVDSLKEKESKFFEAKRNHIKKQEGFKSIPGTPFAYWATDKVREIFETNPKLSDIADPKQGMATADNERFLRLWHETSLDSIAFNCTNADEALVSNKKWFPFNKGGTFRKWYGNQEYVVNWKNNGEEIKEYIIKRYPYLNGNYEFVVKNESFYFRDGITWTAISSSKLAVRFSPIGFLFSNAGMAVFSNNHDKTIALLGFLNSKISFMFSQQLSSTINFDQGIIARLPYKVNENDEINTKIKMLVNKAIHISKVDWDSYESSWNFKRHPFLSYKEDRNRLEDTFDTWVTHTKAQMHELKKIEEELNSIFINLYGLEDEVSPEVEGKDITIRLGERISDSKSFLSYFIGCIMGRYSLNIEGLVYAGGEWVDKRFDNFIPDKFGLIQITDEHYFDNDIVARLREFLAIIFGEETVEVNLQWLAESLVLKRNETAEERLRRYFLDEFFKDHCQVYQKRPVYWLVDSGKQKGLRTLIYMHRYQADTMATIRFEHLQEIQAKYNNEIAAINLRIVNPSLTATEKRDLEKRKTVFQKRLEELLGFDKKLAEYANEQISIDLDDGVKVNYEKFDKVLAKIK
ncbi:BREX-1 system adenine-specific DNA-methyltransferase PglX [Bacillus sp. ISL-47]|uniref:BREX-1 system adenine-specific DNA-methyltransferase PglX n=1 Tax=Bacillus sp. ISL-47 TaxID=2819130 RepID=UPI001BE4FFB3|nr:BREX-1 system adenine-specific DNA-methyltransferase PglX [Bacillus sp. ISL-47]MBT2687282.1 BREX-1 system adenine-specific DNA-methyltransferase PglX [Bacillus sp. ISL-47]MBT2706648.1 BREX-1 system adenine-specific DNA-methyltransferase PglX [Pseudomonas sp. ISL-84]